jgi:hypothetical protein
MLDIDKLEALAEVVEPEELEANKPTKGRTGSLASQVREALEASIVDAIETLHDVVKTANNDQAKTSAARQLLRMAEGTGVLKYDALKDFMDDLNAELDKRESPLPS